MNSACLVGLSEAIVYFEELHRPPRVLMLQAPHQAWLLTALVIGSPGQYNNREERQSLPSCTSWCLVCVLFPHLWAIGSNQLMEAIAARVCYRRSHASRIPPGHEQKHFAG